MFSYGKFVQTTLWRLYGHFTSIKPVQRQKQLSLLNFCSQYYLRILSIAHCAKVVLIFTIKLIFDALSRIYCPAHIASHNYLHNLSFYNE